MNVFLIGYNLVMLCIIIPNRGGASRHPIDTTWNSLQLAVEVVSSPPVTLLARNPVYASTAGQMQGGGHIGAQTPIWLEGWEVLQYAGCFILADSSSLL